MTRSETAKLWAERMMRFEQAEMTVAAVLCGRRRFPALVLQVATQADVCNSQLITQRVQVRARPAANAAKSTAQLDGLCQHDD